MRHDEFDVSANDDSTKELVMKDHWEQRQLTVRAARRLLDRINEVVTVAEDDEAFTKRWTTLVDLVSSLPLNHTNVQTCIWQTSYGMPETTVCGAPCVGRWCSVHEHDARELYPHLPVPTR
jgi:hypothetical protein